MKIKTAYTILIALLMTYTFFIVNVNKQKVNGNEIDFNERQRHSCILKNKFFLNSLLEQGYKGGLA